MVMRGILLLTLTAAAAADRSTGTFGGSSSKTPLITTDILSGTYDLAQDALAYVWEKAHVDNLLAQVPKDQIMKEVNKQVKALPPWVHKGVADADIMWVQVKDAVRTASKPANEMAVKLITQFENMAPAYQGLIRKTPGDLAVFLLYIALVLYIIVKVVLFAVRTIFSIFFGVCCCGMCRRRAPTNGNSNHKAKGAAPAVSADAAQKGKAAMAKAPANAAKPNSNKKK